MCTIIIGSSYSFRFPSFFCVLCFIKVKLSVKVKLFVLLLCLCAILPAKAVLKMTCTVSGGTLNATHSITHLHSEVKYCENKTGKRISESLKRPPFFASNSLWPL